MPIVRETPAARVAPQVVVVSLKSAELAPPMLIDAIAIAIFPLFSNVAFFAILGLSMPWFPNAMLVGVKVAVKVPMPVRTTVCGPPGALSLSTNSALLASVACGENFNVIKQLAPGARASPLHGSLVL